jgi:hypothetical protein
MESTDLPTATISQAEFEEYGFNSLATLVYFLLYFPGAEGRPGHCRYFHHRGLHMINEDAVWYKVQPIIFPRQSFIMTEDGQRINLIWER